MGLVREFVDQLEKRCYNVSVRRHGSVAERVLGKNEVLGSIPSVGSIE